MKAEFNEHLLDGVLARGAVTLALALSAGPVLWAWLVERQRALPPARGRVIATLVLLASAGVLGIVQATFAFAQQWSFAGMWLVLSDTAYGRTLATLLAIAAVHVLALARMGRRVGHATVASGAALALTLTLLGHASVQSAWQVGIQLVHASAAVAWFGMVLVLLEQVARGTARRNAVLRFSRIAAALVGILVATGVLRIASFVLEGDDAVAWFAVLVFKLALFASALVVAAGHRRSRFHGLREADAPRCWRRFQRWLTLECWVVTCALFVAALLSQLPPPS